MKGLLILRSFLFGSQNTGYVSEKLDKGPGLYGQFLFAKHCGPFTDTQTWNSQIAAIPKACGILLTTSLQEY